MPSESRIRLDEILISGQPYVTIVFKETVKEEAAFYKYPHHDQLTMHVDKRVIQVTTSVLQPFERFRYKDKLSKYTL